MTDVSIAFGGGMALAAYHAGVAEAALSHNIRLSSFAGASAGAVTCAILAGAPDGEGIRRLKRFWSFDQAQGPRLSSWQGWTSVLARRVLGETGQFHLRQPIENIARFKSVYDLAPMKSRLNELVDFERLNNGPRVCVAATDIRTGDPVIFDTKAGDRISIDHILASCGFLPEFAPVEIGGRLLGDGGLSLNVPFEPLLEEASEAKRPLLLVDLFPRDGRAPKSLAAASERKSDLVFGNQTYLRLRAALRDPQLAGLATYLLSYRNEGPEAGAEKPYDYARDAIAQRWRAGALDMAYALQASQPMGSKSGITVIRR